MIGRRLFELHDRTVIYRVPCLGRRLLNLYHAPDYTPVMPPYPEACSPDLAAVDRAAPGRLALAAATVPELPGAAAVKQGTPGLVSGTARPHVAAAGGGLPGHPAGRV